MAKGIPNIISLARIVIAVIPLFMEGKTIFFICYLLGGISDVIDGYVARKYNLQTRLGAKLDSLGDFVFWLVVLWLLYQRSDIFNIYVIFGFGIVALTRLANLVITKIKFKQWGMLHTVGNKTTGLLLYAAVPVVIVLGLMPWLCWASFLLLLYYQPVKKW